MHTELIILVSDCRSFLQITTVALEVNCTPLCVQSGWKIHSSKVDTTQKRQVWLYSQPWYSYISKLEICFPFILRQVWYLQLWSDIYNMPLNFFSFLPSLSSNPQTRLPAVGSLTKWQWIGTERANLHSSRDGWLKTNKCAGSNQMFGVRCLAYAKHSNHAVWHI